MSVTEVFEAETKIRLQNTLMLEDMPLSLEPKEQKLDAEMLIAKYGIKLTQSDLKASQNDVPALAYIADYCAHAAIKRQACEDWAGCELCVGPEKTFTARPQRRNQALRRRQLVP